MPMILFILVMMVAGLAICLAVSRLRFHVRLIAPLVAFASIVMPAAALAESGQQKIYQGRENPGWKGAKEWDVPGTNNRILERTLPDGRRVFGYVVDHQYRVTKTFPGPWYADGGKP
jgi:hypothetical protein